MSGGALEITTLVLVRHGEAVCNVERRAGGLQGCTGLSDDGRRQSEALRDRLRRTGELRPDAIYASTLPRAMETAQIVCDALPGVDIVGDDDLHELRPGEADGLTWEEIDERFGGPLDIEVEPDRPLAPGGESWSAFQERIRRVLARIVDDNVGRTVLVVAHGGVVDGALSLFFGLSPLAVRTINTAITEIARETWPGRPPRWLLRRYNDAGHLEGIPHWSGYPSG